MGRAATRAAHGAGAVVAVAIALAVTHAVPPLHDRAVWSIYALAVLATAAFGGTATGLLATALGAAVAARFSLPPGIPPAHTAVLLGVWIVAGVIVSAGIGLIRRSLRERRRLLAEERALRAAAEIARARARRLVDSNIIGVVVLERHRVVEANHAFLTLTGFDANDLRSLDASAAITTPEQRDRDAEAFAELLATGRCRPYEKEILGKDGRRIPVVIGAALVNREPLECVCFVLDMTERRRAEDALRCADEHKNEFLAMLGHELRNPLAALDNAFELLRMGKHVDYALGLGERQLERLRHLVDDLLDVSRISRGKIALRKAPVDVHHLVALAVAAVQPVVAGRHTLTVDVSPAPMWVEGDLLRLEQVLVNLLTNAAKYTNAPGRIWLTAAPAGAVVRLSVRDDGIGIAPDMLREVFSPFAQAHPAAGRAEGGLGIGLTLVDSLVALHGGTVEARSDGAGRGTELVVELPLADAGRAAAKAAPSWAEAAGEARVRILVVDDNPAIADSMQMLLEASGWDARVARDGPAALALAREWRPDVALLDIGLPGMDGHALARALRREPGLAGLRLIAISGWGREQDRVQARESGFDAHLTKPIDWDTLLAMLAAPPGGERAVAPPA